MKKLSSSEIKKIQLDMLKYIDNLCKKIIYNPETMTRLDSSKLEKLGWVATTSIKEMLENTKKTWKSE